MKTSKIGKKVSSTAVKPSVVLPGPDDMNEPPDDFNSYVSIIYGESGIGKTSLLSKFPNSVTLMLEPKRRGLKMRMYEVQYIPMSKMKKHKGVYPWDEIKAFIDQCIKDDSVETVAIDNVDRAYELCSNKICFDAGINHPNDAQDFGATWNIVREEFAECFDRVIYSGKGLVFSSKYDFKEVTHRDGSKYERLQPSCNKQCFRYIMECTDFGIYYGFEEGRRAFIVRSTEDIWTKIGPEDTFMDPSGRPVNVIEAGESAEEAYQSLVDAFANERVDLLRALKAESKPTKKKSKING